MSAAARISSNSQGGEEWIERLDRALVWTDRQSRPGAVSASRRESFYCPESKVHDVFLTPIVLCVLQECRNFKTDPPVPRAVRMAPES